MNTTTLPTRGKMVNSFDSSKLDHLEPATRAQVQRRIRLLGPAYRLFYQNPVSVVRGQGVFLYDATGNDYLDAYNNVVSVGHSHPRVVDAVTQQMQTLCTHTRYVQESILSYAEDLLSTVGGRIGTSGHAMFTCTGSEANDLAMRIAQHHTGKQGIIITSEAYHGNSHLTAGFSPSLGSASPLGTWVRQVPSPDSYRISPEKMGRWLADHVAEQIRDLERHGNGVAAFIADGLFSSDGIYSHPANLYQPIADVVRKAGGLFVADEVQSGFGRSGEKFWGYQRHGVDPDIITMGKPMGNGFPVAGIAIAPEVIEKFGRDMRYFNTFGGNTVAIAAAQATLDVIRDENLQANALKVGDILLAGLRELATRHECIGDVRGVGMYVGVELVKNRQSKEPDAAAATAAVNGLRERRVLISATGFHANTLKIRPPLIFSEANVDRLITQLDAVLLHSR
jgi:4-aminobutyrate aminotransferase-like enzyme